jgi:hypothetical protein
MTWYNIGAVVDALLLALAPLLLLSPLPFSLPLLFLSPPLLQHHRFFRCHFELLLFVLPAIIVATLVFTAATATTVTVVAAAIAVIIAATAALLSLCWHCVAPLSHPFVAPAGVACSFTSVGGIFAAHPSYG